MRRGGTPAVNCLGMDRIRLVRKPSDGEPDEERSELYALCPMPQCEDQNHRAVMTLRQICRSFRRTQPAIDLRV